MAEKKTKLAEGKITEEALDQLRSRIGMKLRIHPDSGNRNISEETIRKFVNGTGDINPLYRDPEYAKKTRYGKLVAPPSWLYSVFQMGVMHGLAGVHGWHSGDDWEFYKPLLDGDRIKPEAIFKGFEETKSGFSDRMIKVYQDRLYYNQRDELVAKALGWTFKAEQSNVRKKGKYAKLELPHPWTDEERDEIDDQIMAMKIRGPEVLYFEDVNIGDEVPQVIKGPIGITDEAAFYGGTSGRLMAHEAALAGYKKHPAWGFRAGDTTAWEPRAAVHWLIEAAQGAGLPYMYEIGMERNSWTIQMFTSWIGDEGWLKNCYAEYRAFIYLGDVAFIKGTVTKKYDDENGEPCVDVEILGTNQRKETIVKGHGTVILPSREKKTWPLESRLAK
ncbi:MAG: MaoC family dehydratase N-terminal domain-containing protein [Deltaproteobacteria bacterium]|nr:MaoC family dehydratase N-terminal domain-containing protein [Deltaproteobacteria bacterium]